MTASLRAVALPAEHGGWSLTLEPVLLGLLVEPSLSGLALGGAALLAFLVRTPLKIVLGDLLRGRHLERTRSAGLVAAVELVAIGVLAVVAVLTAAQLFWWPLAAAAPLVVVELWYDIRSRSRRLIPELAGSVGVASIASAIALAGGSGGLVAAGLWCVAGARAIAAIGFVRVQLRRAKSQSYRLASSDGAQVAAAAIGLAGFALDAVPLVGLVALAGLGTVHVALVRRPVPAVPVLGAQQVVLGLVVVLTTALGVRAPG